MVGFSVVVKGAVKMTGSLRSDKGKFYAVLNLKDEFGKRKQKAINLNIDDVPGNKRKAQRALREVVNEHESNHIVVYQRDVLFCEYIKVWLEEAKPGIEVDTYESYECYVNLHLYPYFQNLKVSLRDLSYQHIQKYYEEKSKTLSANSLRKHHTIINQTLKKALKLDMINSNPADKVTLPKVQRFVGRYLSVEDGNTLLEAAQDEPIETAVILGMMYGLRRSEIAGLKWSAIDFVNDTLTINHTVTRCKTVIAKDRTKNKSSNRILPLNPEVKSFLSTLKRKQAENKLLLGRAYQNTDYICRYADGQPMTCDYLTRAFKSLLVKNGLPDIRLHDLRHSCASYMLKMGCSMKEIADWLGHSDITTAMNIYAHIDFEHKKEVANRFKSILSLKV